jgi:hypothetical protein
MSCLHRDKSSRAHMSCLHRDKALKEDPTEGGPTIIGDGWPPTSLGRHPLLVANGSQSPGLMTWHITWIDDVAITSWLLHPGLYIGGTP